MQKNKIKVRKARRARRNAHDFILKSTAVIMGMTTIASALMYAFHKPSSLYTVMFVFSFGWLAVFSLANGGVEE